MQTNEVDLQSYDNIIEDNSTIISNVEQSIQPIISKEFNLFPKKLEYSGYVILATVGLIFGISFLLNVIIVKKLISITKKSQTSLIELTNHLYIQQQIMEYRLLLSELNGAETAVEKTNARTQLYNYLNNLSLDICTLSNYDKALQLAKFFFSKIYGRYIKLNALPDGIIYFKYVGSSLNEMKGMSEQDILKVLRKNYKSHIKKYQEVTREIFDTSLNNTKGFFKNKNK